MVRVEAWGWYDLLLHVAGQDAVSVPAKVFDNIKGD